MIALTIAHVGVPSTGIARIVEEERGIRINARTVRNIRYDAGFKWGHPRK
jgi:transposase